VHVAFRTTIRPDDDNSWTEILQEVPACTGDGKQVKVGGGSDPRGKRSRGAEKRKGRVVLEEKVGFDADAPDIAEHVGHLKMIRIRAKAIKSVLTISSIPQTLGRKAHIS